METSRATPKALTLLTGRYKPYPLHTDLGGVTQSDLFRRRHQLGNPSSWVVVRSRPFESQTDSGLHCCSGNKHTGRRGRERPFHTVYAGPPPGRPRDASRGGCPSVLMLATEYKQTNREGKKKKITPCKNNYKGNHCLQAGRHRYARLPDRSPRKSKAAPILRAAAPQTMVRGGGGKEGGSGCKRTERSAWRRRLAAPFPGPFRSDPPAPANRFAETQDQP